MRELEPSLSASTTSAEKSSSWWATYASVWLSGETTAELSPSESIPQSAWPSGQGGVVTRLCSPDASEMLHAWLGGLLPPPLATTAAPSGLTWRSIVLQAALK